MSKLIKEYVSILLIESSLSPKAIFMAGAPGSGKSSIINSLNIENNFTIVNPDTEYEAAKLKNNLPFNKEIIIKAYSSVKKKYEEAEAKDKVQTIKNLEKDYIRLKSILSNDAKAFVTARINASKKKKELSSKGTNYLVDGTGGNYNEINSQVKELKDLGYDVAMIYNDIDIEESLKRDKERSSRGGRTLGSKIVEKSHRSVEKNKEPYKELFGENFFYINSSSDTFKKDLESIREKLSSFISK